MSNLVDHAQRELELCGQFEEDPAYAQSIVAAVAAFASYGHSGGSAMCAIDQLTRLLNFDNLSPLTDGPEEWQDHTDISGEQPMFQNRRNGKAFSEDGGKTYYLLDEEPRVYHASRKVME